MSLRILISSEIKYQGKLIGAWEEEVEDTIYKYCQLADKFVDMLEKMGPVDLIITRHEATMDILKEAFPKAKVLTGNVTEEDVAGKRVAGVLPIPLASKCEYIINTSLEIPVELRGHNLEIIDTLKYLKINKYKVTEA